LFNVAPPGQNGTTPYQSGTVPFQSVIDFQLGQQYTVSMSAFSQAVCDGGLTNCYSDQAEGTAAFVDPTFTLGAVGEVVGIGRGAFSGNMRVSFQAARSIG
jgi:hypothetical protein